MRKGSAASAPLARLALATKARMASQHAVDHRHSPGIYRASPTPTHQHATGRIVGNDRAAKERHSVSGHDPERQPIDFW